MSLLTDEAGRHQEARIRVSDEVSRRVVRLWRRVPADALDAGWYSIAPELRDVVSAGQVRAAAQATRYVDRVGKLQGVAGSAVLVPEAFAGATREGREVVPELYAAVTTTKTLIGRGVAVPQAFQAGAAFMSVMASTLITDTGRGADQALAVSRGFRYSVRVVNPGACSRCAILAGVVGYRENFKRHPRCRCTSMPLYDDQVPNGFFRSTGDYFESLSPGEQDRVFTKAGAEAIRLGADPARVVNARRGYSRGSSAVSPTGDGIRSSRRIRVMPEQIMREATSPERARVLLERNGFIR